MVRIGMGVGLMVGAAVVLINLLGVVGGINVVNGIVVLVEGTVGVEVGRKAVVISDFVMGVMGKVGVMGVEIGVL